MGLKLLTDISLCTGCFSCEVACKQEHDLPTGPKFIKVIQVGPKKINDSLVMDFIPMHCMHCDKPPCIDSCPVDAISKRNDGVVIYDENLCIGCGKCIEVCPFGAPQMHPVKKVAQACNLCQHRIDQQLQPACVNNCPNNALIFGDPNEIANKFKKNSAARMIYRGIIS